MAWEFETWKFCVSDGVRPVFKGLYDSDGIDTDSPIFFKSAGYEKRRKDPDPAIHMIS